MLVAPPRLRAAGREAGRAGIAAVAHAIGNDRERVDLARVEDCRAVVRGIRHAVRILVGSRGEDDRHHGAERDIVPAEVLPLHVETGNDPLTILSTYLIEKGKPIAEPGP